MYFQIITSSLIALMLNYTAMSQTWIYRNKLESKAYDLFNQCRPLIEERLAKIETQNEIHDFDLNNHKVRTFYFELDSLGKISKSKFLIDEFLYFIIYGRIHTVHLIGPNFYRSEDGPGIELLVVKHFVQILDSTIVFTRDTISYNHNGNGIDCFSYQEIGNNPAYQTAFLPRTQYPSGVYEYKNVKEFYFKDADTLEVKLRAKNGVFRKAEVRLMFLESYNGNMHNEEYEYTLDRKQRIKRVIHFNYDSPTPNVEINTTRMPWRRRKVFIYDVKDRVHVMRELGLKVF